LADYPDDEITRCLFLSREREPKLRLHRRRNAKGLIPISAEDNARRYERANMNARERSEDAWSRYVALKHEQDTQTPSLMLRRRTALHQLIYGLVVFVVSAIVLLLLILWLVGLPVF